jgi:hypothetical protein
MGLDWVIQPLPDGARTDSENEYTHKYEWTLRAKKLQQIGLPKHIENKLQDDMTAWEMKSLSDTLQQELTENSEEYTNKEQEMIRKSTAWLNYWSNKEKSIYASY